MTESANCNHARAEIVQSASGNESWFHCPECGGDFDSIHFGNASVRQSPQPSAEAALCRPALCPHCGHAKAPSVDAASELDGIERDDDNEQWKVCCDVNDGGCGASGGFHTSIAEAIEAWNTRPLPAESDGVTNASAGDQKSYRGGCARRPGDLNYIGPNKPSEEVILGWHKAEIMEFRALLASSQARERQAQEKIERLKLERAGAMHSGETWELMHAKRHEELERALAEVEQLKQQLLARGLASQPPAEPDAPSA